MEPVNNGAGPESITESFDGSDGSTIGSGLTWTEDNVSQ